MADAEWKMPVPPTAITRGPNFKALPRRQCELSFYIEVETGDKKESLLFDGVEAYKCTYLAALNVEMINATYGKLVDLGETEWLSEIVKVSTVYYTKSKKTPPSLKHFAICFDDGPCFEIVCVNFNPLAPTSESQA
ncbi:MAG: hypothetical protein U1E28_02050 [Beijerinckiaceae bacterium]